MGDQRARLTGKNDMGAYLFTAKSPRITINGVTGRMIADKRDPNGEHPHLPAYAKTCTVYFYPGPDGKAVQAKVYKDGRMIMDIDWSHTHVNNVRKGGDGKVFPKGTAHIQEYRCQRIKDPKTGKWKDKFVRLSNFARSPTAAERKLLGGLIHYFNPDVIF